MELLQQDGGLEQLKEWPSELALKFEQMLMEHHHIFSLDKNEIGCTDTAEHIIELMDDEPFKEKFWRIAPPLLEEVPENLQDMLDGGADSFPVWILNPGFGKYECRKNPGNILPSPWEA